MTKTKTELLAEHPGSRVGSFALDVRCGKLNSYDQESFTFLQWSLLYYNII